MPSPVIVRSFQVQNFDLTESNLNYSALYALNAIKECLTRVDSKERYWTLDNASLSGQGFSTTAEGHVEKIVIKNSYYLRNQLKHQKISLRSVDDTVSTYYNRTIAVKLFPDDYLGGDPNFEIVLPATKAFSSVQNNAESLITGGQYTTSPSYDYYMLRDQDGIKRNGISNGTSDGFIIETPDAISVIFKSNLLTSWTFGFHGGIIYTPIDFSDYENFIDGSGILTGLVGLRQDSQFQLSSWMRWDHYFSSARTYQHSKIRIGQNINSTSDSRYAFLSDSYFLLNPNLQVVSTDRNFEPIHSSASMYSATENVNSKPRFVPYELVAPDRLSTPTIATQFPVGLVGYTKYIRRGPISSLNNVFNTEGGVSWIRQNGKNNSTVFYHVWEKDFPTDVMI